MLKDAKIINLFFNLKIHIMLPLKSVSILTVTSTGAGRVAILYCSYTCHYEGDNDYSDILKHSFFKALVYRT